MPTSKNNAIDLGQLQSNFNIAKSKHTAACIVRERARQAFKRTDEQLLMRETDMDVARTSLVQASRTVTQEG